MANNNKPSNKKAEKVSRELYIPLDHSFFVHPKTRLLLSIFGAAGPYIIQLLWRQMYVRDGFINDMDEFELISIAEDSKTDIVTVKKVIEKAVEIHLLSRGKKNNLLHSEEVLRRLNVRIGEHAFASMMGKIGASKRWQKEEPNSSKENSPPIAPPIAPYIAPYSHPIANKEVRNKVSKELNPDKGLYSLTYLSVDSLRNQHSHLADLDLEALWGASDRSEKKKILETIIVEKLAIGGEVLEKSLKLPDFQRMLDAKYFGREAVNWANTKPELSKSFCHAVGGITKMFKSIADDFEDDRMPTENNDTE